MPTYEFRRKEDAFLVIISPKCPPFPSYFSFFSPGMKKGSNELKERRKAYDKAVSNYPSQVNKEGLFVVKKIPEKGRPRRLSCTNPAWMYALEFFLKEGKHECDEKGIVRLVNTLQPTPLPKQKKSG